jgi:hypothetical protein
VIYYALPLKNYFQQYLLFQVILSEHHGSQQQWQLPHEELPVTLGISQDMPWFVIITVFQKEV